MLSGANTRISFLDEAPIKKKTQSLLQYCYNQFQLLMLIIRYFQLPKREYYFWLKLKKLISVNPLLHNCYNQSQLLMFILRYFLVAKREYYFFMEPKMDHSKSYVTILLQSISIVGAFLTILSCAQTRILFFLAKNA